MRILIVDTYYPDVIKALPIDPLATYAQNLERVLSFSFGTFDAYSRNLKALGWEVADIIANHLDLQQMWAEENLGGMGLRGADILEKQLEAFDGDVLFLQDLSLANKIRQDGYLVAGQCSCPWPGNDAFASLQIVYTSFPHYVPRIEALGVKAVYNPLAFEPSILPAEFFHFSPHMPERIHDCVFIGGVGNPSHWKYGMEVLETVAREIPTFKWWGYGVDTLPRDSALRQKYYGEAFGKDMYEILLRSKVCLNRHGEVSEGYSNNMRMYEATGCGALLLTEASKNLSDLFSANEVVSYLTPGDAVQKVRHYLHHADERDYIAGNGQRRTLKDHTYLQRMKVVSDTLKEILVVA